VYSWAVTAVSFVTRREVFADYWTGSAVRIEFLEDLLENDLRPLLPKKAVKCPDSLRTLLNACWDRDPVKRPTFLEIIDQFERFVLLDSAIPCPKFQNIWVEKVCKNAGVPGLVRDLKWSALEDFFFANAKLWEGFDPEFVSLARLVSYKVRWVFLFLLF
jgi:hypothetical protein